MIHWASSLLPLLMPIKLIISHIFWVEMVDACEALSENTFIDKPISYRQKPLGRWNIFRHFNLQTILLLKFKSKANEFGTFRKFIQYAIANPKYSLQLWVNKQKMHIFQWITVKNPLINSCSSSWNIALTKCFYMSKHESNVILHTIFRQIRNEWYEIPKVNIADSFFDLNLKRCKSGTFTSKGKSKPILCIKYAIFPSNILHKYCFVAAVCKMWNVWGCSSCVNKWMIIDTTSKTN